MAPLSQQTILITGAIVNNAGVESGGRGAYWRKKVGCGHCCEGAVLCAAKIER